MSRPLYQEAAGNVQWQNGHAGLWYDKFCDQWKPDFSGLGDEGKKEWVKSVTGRPVGDREQLQAYVARLEHLLGAHDQLLYTLESPFVTGLGRAHPVENGFAWHHTLGTPYLPGSSVKGMVRAWATQWGEADKETIKRIFGSEDDKDKKFQVGSVVFLDAIPTAPVQLKADVMTPHYGPWYRGEAPPADWHSPVPGPPVRVSEVEIPPPADWHSPVPVPFLVVEKGETFLFGVLPRTQREQDRQDCETVTSWLKEALRWIGAGAKTAVGYGRFAPKGKSAGSSPSPHGAPSSAAAPPSPAEQIVEGLRAVSKKALKSRAQGFVDRLARLELSEAERKAAALAMKRILEEANVKQLHKLNAYRQLSDLAGEP